jgi:hypothetical protein
MYGARLGWQFPLVGYVSMYGSFALVVVARSLGIGFPLGSAQFPLFSFCSATAEGLLSGFSVATYMSLLCWTCRVVHYLPITWGRLGHLFLVYFFYFIFISGSSTETMIASFAFSGPPPGCCQFWM